MHNPARFCTVCPLLVSTPDGWRCSVTPAGVRPFWGRVFRWLGVAAVAGWLTTVTVLWAALHVGNQPVIGWSQLAWPGRWSEIRRLQSRHLFEQAIQAFREGRPDDAHLSLSTAREIYPGNYDAALMLAQIAMFQRSFLFSDGLFTTLWKNFPENRARTAVTYHDTLVALGRLDRLGAFALEMAGVDREHAVVWVQSALIAIRLMPADAITGLREREAAHLAALAPHAHVLVLAELSRREGDTPAAMASLRPPFRGPQNAFYLEYQITRLAELGAGADAQLLLNSQGRWLGEFERRLIQGKVSQNDGDAVLAKGSWRALLRQPLNAVRVERMLAVLVAHPNADFLRGLQERVTADAALTAAVDGGAFWLVAVLSGDTDSAEYWRTHGRQSIAPSAYPRVTKLNFLSWDPAAADAPIHLISGLTLPREIILALFARMSPQANPAAPRGRR